MSQTPKQIRYQQKRRIEKEKKAASINKMYDKLIASGSSREQSIPEVMLKHRCSYPTVLRALNIKK